MFTGVDTVRRRGNRIKGANTVLAVFYLPSAVKSRVNHRV